MKKVDLFKVLEAYELHSKLYQVNDTYKYYRKTISCIKKALEHLKIRNNKQLELDTIDRMIEFYQKNLKKKNSKINDVNSAFYMVLKFYDIKSDLPKQLTWLPDDTDHFEPLTEDEEDKLFDFLSSLDLSRSNNYVWVFTVLLALDTGARKSELLKIKTNNVNLSSGVIRLDAYDTKSKKLRYVPFGDLSKRFIQEAVLNQRKPYLLWNKLKNQQMTIKSIEHFMEMVNETIKPENNITLHRLRKTFATKLYLRGCPILTIQKFLGHSTLEQTLIYLRVADQVIIEDYKKYYPYEQIAATICY